MVFLLAHSAVVIVMHGIKIKYCELRLIIDDI